MKKIILGLTLPFFMYGESLQELIDLSLKNQLIQSSKQNIESIQSEYKSIQNNYLPKVSVGGTYSNTNEETSSTASSSFISYGKIDYVVYDGGKKGDLYGSYENNIKSAKENMNTLKNDISLQVLTYYFNYYTYVAQKEAKQKEIEQLQAQYIRLERFLDAGTTTSDEVDKIISRVESANVSLHESELNIQTVLHNLHYLVSKRVVPKAGSLVEAISFRDETTRADIKALEYDIKTALFNAKAAKSSNYPTLTLDNTFNKYDMNYDNQTYQDNTIDTQNIFKVNLSWTLFDFGTTTQSYNSEYKKYQAIKSKYEYEKNRANIDLQLAVKSYEISKLKIISAKLALKAATSTYEMIEQKYQNGLVDNVGYLESLSEKYNALSLFKKAQYDLEIKKANIIYHCGKNVWEYIK